MNYQDVQKTPSKEQGTHEDETHKEEVREKEAVSGFTSPTQCNVTKPSDPSSPSRRPFQSCQSVYYLVIRDNT